MSATELLPCPFCGGGASLRLFYGSRYGVYCDCCSSRVGGLFQTRDEAIAAWNRRATAQAVEATLGATDAKPTQAESSGTCELDDFADVPFSVDYEIEGYDMDSSRDYATLAECSACGAYVIVPPEYHHVLTCDGDEVYQPYRFCPNCGRRIVDPTTNDVDAVVTNG